MKNEVNKKPPYMVLACDAVSVAAWVENRIIDNEVVEVYSIKFDRSYKDKRDGQWKHTEMFRPEDLLEVAMLATELSARLRLRSYGHKQQGNDILPNTGVSS